MDPRLLQYYNRELRHLRDVGGEFAKEFPKIAGRLGLDGFECADPYVERLLEGFAFLAARVQLKIDAEFPRFTENLLEFVYPHYLAPTPSMTVVQMQPDFPESALLEGYPLARGTPLRSLIGKGEQTPCEYRTAHSLTLWPLQVIAAEYLSNPSAVVNAGAPSLRDVKAGIKLRLKLPANQKFNQLALDKLTLYLRGVGGLPIQVYEQFLANALGVAVLPTSRDRENWVELIEGQVIRRLGFEDDQALLPYTPRSFQGYRLIQEYFAFPERFLFVELSGLNRAIRRCHDSEIELIVLLNRLNPALVNSIDASQFILNCTPAINLFPKRAERIHLTHTESEYHIIPDRTRPLDFETHSLVEVQGYGSHQTEGQAFLPFYGSDKAFQFRDESAYYSLHRVKRLMSAKQRRQGLRSSYVGSETYISLVDAVEAPYRGDLTQLSLQILCTNRDLPLHMPVGLGETDFTLQTGAPVTSIRCVAGPTRPRPSLAGSGMNWRLISHLSLNYLSLFNTDAVQGASAMREMLSLYCDANDEAMRKQIEGLISIQSKNVVRRIDAIGPIVFGRGLEIAIRFDESAFEGGGAFLLGAVIEQFFARYASLNTFTETVVQGSERGEMMRWPIRTGQRHRV